MSPETNRILSGLFKIDSRERDQKVVADLINRYSNDFPYIHALRKSINRIWRGFFPHDFFKRKENTRYIILECSDGRRPLYWTPDGWKEGLSNAYPYQLETARERVNVLRKAIGHFMIGNVRMFDQDEWERTR